jgi:hypothetical protein
MAYGKKTRDTRTTGDKVKEALHGPEAPVQEETAVSVSEIKMGEISFCVLGTTPIVLNRLSEKAKQLLLLPKRKTNRAGLEQTLKHDPLQEYRDSVYQNRSPGAPTRILLHGGAFKRALADVALDIPGAAKATIGRLTGIKETMVNLYGEPELMMAVVRQAGIVKSPDIRTRAVIRNWACKITVSYVSSVISREDVTNLLAASGVIIGVGDWRPQKGAGSFGQFRLCDPADEQWNAIVQTGTTEAQDEALANPSFYDSDTEDLVLWYLDEVKRWAAESEAPRSQKVRGSRGMGRGMGGKVLVTNGEDDEDEHGQEEILAGKSGLDELRAMVEERGR